MCRRLFTWVLLWPIQQGLKDSHTHRTELRVSRQARRCLRFRVFEERFTGPLFLDFLKRLLRDAKGRKIIVIVDGHPAHRARIVRDWITEHPDEIELHFLPGYAPELNPAEMLNCDVKANVLGRRRPLDVTQLKADVHRYLRARQRRPWQVAKYFHERHVTYAAGPTI